MKIAIMGDTHFDFYFSSNSSSISERLFHLKIGYHLENIGADVLIIAGDLGHYNAQNIQALRLLKKYVERIIVTFGNHDYYLISKSIVSKYQYKSGRLGGSHERVAEMKVMIEDEDGIEYVDGNVIEIDGIRIGGATGWYDGSLLYDNRKTTDEIQAIWEKDMNDANTIYPTAKHGMKFDTLFKEQKHRLDAVYQNCDIMVSHVSPLSEWKQFVEMYNYHKPLEGFYQNFSSTHEALQDYRAFYCFDGKEYLDNGSMTHWIFGHTHRNFSRTYQREDGKEIEIICNSIGYPRLAKDKIKSDAFEIKIIEIKTGEK